MDDARRAADDACSAAELDAEAAFELPDRQALSIFDMGGLGSGLVSTGQTTPNPTQMTGQTTTDPTQANQPIADATSLGNQTTAGAVQSATTSPQTTYQPSTTSTAQS